jgi:hypothetical protein
MRLRTFIFDYRIELKQLSKDVIMGLTMRFYPHSECLENFKVDVNLIRCCSHWLSL